MILSGGRRVFGGRSDVFAASGGAGARAGALALALATGLIALAAAAVLAVGFAERFDPLGTALLLLWLGAMGATVQRTAAGQPGWAPVALLLILSMVLRVWSASLTSGVSLGADPMNYTNLATALLEGRGLVTDDWQYGKDLRAYFPPLYPILLAGFWGIFGASASATLAMNTAIDAAAAWCLGDAGRRMGCARAGRLAAIAYFAWPAFALAAGIPQKESLTLLFLLLLLRGMTIWLGEAEPGARRWRHGLWLGLWWGLLALTQPSLALAPAAAAPLLAWQKGLLPAIRLGLAALPALLLVLLPWWLRNWLLFGSFVPFTTASGMMMNAALGNLRVPFPPGLFELTETERTAVMGDLARRAIASDPAAFFQEAGRIHALGFAYEEASLARFRHTSPPISAAEHARLAPVLQGAYAAMLASAAAGAWRAFRARRVDPVILYAAILLASIGAINFWFEFGERHRLGLTPFLLLIAAGSWLSLAARAPRAGPASPAAEQPLGARNWGRAR